jgi:integrase
MRAHEIIMLTVGDAARGHDLTWIGKRRKQRTAKLGRQLRTELDAYLARYAAAVGRPLTDDDPLFCPMKGFPGGRVNWGVPIRHTDTVRTLLRHAAFAANLPRIAPHDLKRTAARMMHEAKAADGGHIFTAVEIADVLDHTNLDVTRRCYIGPLDTAAKERAADLFD